MEYTTKDINNIFEFKTWTDKKKIDELLRLDAQMYCNLGIDSTAFERTEVKKTSKNIYQIMFVRMIKILFIKSVRHRVYIVLAIIKKFDFSFWNFI